MSKFIKKVKEDWETLLDNIAARSLKWAAKRLKYKVTPHKPRGRKAPKPATKGKRK